MENAPQIVITLDIKGIYKHMYLPMMAGYCSIGKCFKGRSNYLFFFSKGKHRVQSIGQCFKSMIKENKKEQIKY